MKLLEIEGHVASDHIRNDLASTLRQLDIDNG